MNAVVACPLVLRGQAAISPVFDRPKSLMRSEEMSVIRSVVLGTGVVVLGFFFAFLVLILVLHDLPARVVLQGDEEVESLKLQLTPLIERLEQNRQRLGRYPESLASISETLPTTRFGSWEYLCENEGKRCYFRVGDYVDNGFILWWCSSDGRWYLDI